MTDAARRLVLGGGGVVGTAWMAGLASGLRHEGVDLADADLIVGTSARILICSTTLHTSPIKATPRPRRTRAG